MKAEVGGRKGREKRRGISGVAPFQTRAISRRTTATAGQILGLQLREALGLNKAIKIKNAAPLHYCVLSSKC